MEMGRVEDRVRAIAAEFARERSERLRRRALDPADFATLREAGYLLTGVSAAQGGVWESPELSTRPLAEMLRAIASADPSLALVASMHPAVTSSGGWLTLAEAPPPYTEAWERQRQWVAETVHAGAWWGTLVSEPGSGGDTSQVRASARSDPTGAGYRLSGVKHFGSGSGIASYWITTAVPEGEKDPDHFVLDLRGRRGTARPACSSWRSGMDTAWPRLRVTPLPSRTTPRGASAGPPRRARHSRPTVGWPASGRRSPSASSRRRWRLRA